MVIVMIIGLVEPGQGEKLRRNNKKKGSGRERQPWNNDAQPRKKKLIKRQLVVL